MRFEDVLALLSRPIAIEVLVITATALASWGVARWIIHRKGEGLGERARMLIASWGVPLAVTFGSGIAGAVLTVFGQASDLVWRFSFLVLVWVLVGLVGRRIPDLHLSRAARLVVYLLTAELLLPPIRLIKAHLESLHFAMGTLYINMLGVLNGIIVLLVALWVGFGLGNLIEKRLNAFDLSPSLKVLTGKLIRIALLIVAGLAACDAMGLDITLLTVLGGGLGLGLGFGLQKVISNLVSGFILLADRSIKPGDVIEIEGTFGWINNLKGRYVSVITRDGKEHLIPNEDLITQRVINWSYSHDNVRIHLPIGVSYSSDVHLVRKLILQGAEEVPRVLKSPKPVCFMVGYGNSSVDFELRFWINDPANGVSNVKSALYFRIWDLFKEHAIEIPFPQNDVHLRSPDAIRVRMVGDEEPRPQQHARQGEGASREAGPDGARQGEGPGA
ncbi:MAG: mechanosensitive ion channel protein MscS [Puniceicoccaceae bacterium 5H]|nr:MAG: mechanosensitive ion channel protein MscS [Puniceicoccaceae bacterium 5H]